MEFCYWPIKGLAEYQRWVMAYCGAEYKEKNVTDWDKWCQEKNSLGLDFPNLPYLIDNEFKVSESQAISHYIAGKYMPELLGKDFTEQAKVRQINGVFHDIKESSDVIYEKEENYKEAFEKSLIQHKTLDKVAALSKFLAEKEFFHGHVTLNDIEFGPLYYLIWAICRTHGVENPFEKYSNLKSLNERVRKLPGIKEYLATPAAKRPQNSPGYLQVPLKED